MLRWFARITSIREISRGETVSYNGTWQAKHDKTRVATLGVGYGDGYPRALSNKSQVFLHQSFAPVIGLVCMDQMMIDVTHLPTTQIGDSVELVGENVRVPTLARLAETNSHEIVTRLMTRVNRKFVF